MWPIEKKIYALSFLLHGLDHESMASGYPFLWSWHERFVGLWPSQTMEKKGRSVAEERDIFSIRSAHIVVFFIICFFLIKNTPERILFFYKGWIGGVVFFPWDKKTRIPHQPLIKKYGHWITTSLSRPMLTFAPWALGKKS